MLSNGLATRFNLDDDVISRLHTTTALFLAASFLVFIPASLLDSRLLDSAPIWIKPQKFNISLALHFMTLAILAQQLPRSTRTGPAMQLFSYLAVAAVIFEYVYVLVQAGRGRRSHFNFDTNLEALLYAAMGVGAILLILIALTLAIQIWRKGDRSNRGLWLGSVVGLTSGFGLTLLFASYMSNTSRYVGAPLSGGGAVIPILGWSREYGDLRPAHFVSLHLMQTVPIAGWLADKKRWNATTVVIGITSAQVLLATLLFLQARAGLPIWPI